MYNPNAAVAEKDNSLAEKDKNTIYLECNFNERNMKNSAKINRCIICYAVTLILLNSDVKAQREFYFWEEDYDSLIVSDRILFGSIPPDYGGIPIRFSQFVNLKKDRIDVYIIHRYTDSAYEMIYRYDSGLLIADLHLSKKGRKIDTIKSSIYTYDKENLTITKRSILPTSKQLLTKFQFNNHNQIINFNEYRNSHYIKNIYYNYDSNFNLINIKAKITSGVKEKDMVYKTVKFDDGLTSDILESQILVDSTIKNVYSILKNIPLINMEITSNRNNEKKNFEVESITLKHSDLFSFGYKEYYESVNRRFPYGYYSVLFRKLDNRIYEILELRKNLNHFEVYNTKFSKNIITVNIFLDNLPSEKMRIKIEKYYKIINKYEKY